MRESNLHKSKAQKYGQVDTLLHIHVEIHDDTGRYKREYNICEAILS